MPRPTATQLIERLREIESGHAGVARLSDEKLAGRLPISLSTFNRWKRGDTDTFSDVVEMLDRAGWLNIDVDGLEHAGAPRDRLAELEATVEAQGAATTTALKALTAGIRKLERQLAAEDRAASQKAARR